MVSELEQPAAASVAPEPVPPPAVCATGHTGLAAARRLQGWRRPWRPLAAAVAVAVVSALALATRPDRAATPTTFPRIVVLPFKNLGPAGQDDVAAGLTEEITGRLSGMRNLHVISRTTAMAFQSGGRTVRDVARDLDVDHVLEGAVAWDAARSPSRVRITVQLIRTADDTHLWSDSFDRAATDLFRLQSEIATRVVGELRANILASERAALEAHAAANLDAYRAYLLGLSYARRADVSRVGMTRTIAALQGAVDLDPGFAPAHAALALAHARYARFGYDSSTERASLVRRAVERAEALAPRTADTYLARAMYLRLVDAPAAGLEVLRQAATLRPRDATIANLHASLLSQIGSWDESFAAAQRAVALDPRDASLLADAALVGLATRRYAQAAHFIDQSIATDPDQLLAYVLQVWCEWLWKGDLRAARTLLDRLPADDWRYAELRFLQGLHEGDVTYALQGLAPFAGTWMRGALLVRPIVLLEAQAWRLKGDAGRAHATFADAARLLAAEVRDTPDDMRLRSSLAIAYAGLGRRDDARREARQAIALMRWPDSLPAATVREDVALALTMIGAHDDALREIARLVAKPAHFSAQVLRLDPRWAPLRAHPAYTRLALDR